MRRIRARQDHIQVAHDGPSEHLQLELFEDAQAARDEFRVRDPVFVEQPHPAQAKGLAPLAPARADKDHARAQAPRRAQLQRAPRVVEYHDIRPPVLEQVDDGRGMERGR